MPGPWKARASGHFVQLCPFYKGEMRCEAKAWLFQAIQTGSFAFALPPHLKVLLKPHPLRKPSLNNNTEPTFRCYQVFYESHLLPLVNIY